MKQQENYRFFSSFFSENACDRLRLQVKRHVLVSDRWCLNSRFLFLPVLLWSYCMFTLKSKVPTAPRKRHFLNWKESGEARTDSNHDGCRKGLWNDNLSCSLVNLYADVFIIHSTCFMMILSKPRAAAWWSVFTYRITILFCFKWKMQLSVGFMFPLIQVQTWNMDATGSIVFLLLLMLFQKRQTSFECF